MTVARDVVEARARRDPRVRYHANPRNLGMVANWNACLDRANAPLAVRHTLAIANRVHAQNDAAHWPENDRIIAEIGQTADAAEGARAFIEKRKPVWQGK